MMDDTIVYKLFERDSSGRLCSINGLRNWTLEYEQYSQTKPAHGYLFAFKRASDARDHRGLFFASAYWELWRCKATGLQNMDHQPTLIPTNAAQYMDFWSGSDWRRGFDGCMPLPTGTVFCETIEPLWCIDTGVKPEEME